MRVEIRKVPNNSYARRRFREISRITTRHQYEPTDGARVYFGYIVYDMDCSKPLELLAGVGCCFPADKRVATPKTELFSDPYYHHISLLFVTRKFQGFHVGRNLMYHMEDDMMDNIVRPIHLEGSARALRFYQHLGYDMVENGPRLTFDDNIAWVFRKTYLLAKSPFSWSPQKSYYQPRKPMKAPKKKIEDNGFGQIQYRSSGLVRYNPVDNTEVVLESSSLESGSTV